MPVRPGIFSYGGWTVLSVLGLVVTGWVHECRAGEDPLDVVLVMDNSTSMAQSDPDFVMLAGADLMLSLLRPGDHVHLVSAGAEASIVLTGTGMDKEKFREAIARLHREASASDPVSVVRLLVKHFEKLKGKSMRQLVFWFTGKQFTYNISKPEYYPDEKMLSVIAQTQQDKGLAVDPSKIKDLKGMQPDVMERIGQIIEDQTELLDALGVRINLVVAGKQYDAPGNMGKEVTGFMSSMTERTGGRFVTLDGQATLSALLSTFIASVNAPTQTVEPSSMGPKGESFEVFRGCRHMWVVLLFGIPPMEFSFTAQDVASEMVMTWPFGKPPEDVYLVKPHVEKGLAYKEKRWYQVPESPVGFAVFSVKDPLPGNYRVRVAQDRALPYLLRILQDVDLEYGFLEEPSHAIPLGMEFSASAALKHPEGYSYVFKREFVEKLGFMVLMRSIDGGLPGWGTVQSLVPSREGETSFTFSPDEAGTYFLKGKVIHDDGEFVAYMTPHRLDVHPRIPLRFAPVVLEWTSTTGEEWTDVEPLLRIAPGVEIPADMEFVIEMDTSMISGAEQLVFDPAGSFTISKERPEVGLRVKYKDSASNRIRGGRYEGKLVLSVDDMHKQIVDGSGVWEIPVEGRFSSWGMARFHEEYSGYVYGLLAFLIMTFLLFERFLRPRFSRGLRFVSWDVIGGRERKHEVDAGQIFRPIVPFVRQKIVIGMGGDVGLYRDTVLCVIVPTRGGFDILPRGAPIQYEDGDGDRVEVSHPFAGVLDRLYTVGGDSGRLEFRLSSVPNEPDR